MLPGRLRKSKHGLSLRLCSRWTTAAMTIRELGWDVRTRGPAARRSRARGLKKAGAAAPLTRTGKATHCAAGRGEPDAEHDNDRTERLPARHRNPHPLGNVADRRCDDVGDLAVMNCATGADV